MQSGARGLAVQGLKENCLGTLELVSVTIVQGGSFIVISVKRLSLPTSSSKQPANLHHKSEPGLSAYYVSENNNGLQL